MNMHTLHFAMRAFRWKSVWFNGMFTARMVVEFIDGYPSGKRDEPCRVYIEANLDWKDGKGIEAYPQFGRTLDGSLRIVK